MTPPRAQFSPRSWPAALGALGALVWLLGLTSCDTQLDRPATFGYIHAAILVPSCATASCHSQGAAEEDIDLSHLDAAYYSLTGVLCGEADPGLYVNPKAPERSAILSIMRSTGGDRMPPDLELPAEEIALVERWIAEGAPCD